MTWRAPVVLAASAAFFVLAFAAAAPSSPPRGAAGDLVADIELGRRDFTEISPNSVVPNKLGRPGGTVVDRSVSPGRMYVWDGYNNRILGFDLATCYGQSGNCTADLVIGQPSMTDWGACNRDSSMAAYPQRAAATASTLCSEPDYTSTVLEDGSNVSMWVDQSSGDLYVPDFFNNRVLRFVSPFTTDSVADEVWGQADFSGVYCNRVLGTNPFSGEVEYHGGGPPTAQSLCFRSVFASGAGVTLDEGGNLWVADGGNNRVLRFPQGSKTADLVIGQPNFSTRDKGTSMSQMAEPTAVAFGPSGELYVTDPGTFGIGNQRVLVFTPPFTTGMAASRTFGSGYGGTNSGSAIETVMNDPWNRGIWTLDNHGWKGYPTLRNYDGTLRQQLDRTGVCDQTGGGSLGFDSDRGVLGSFFTNCSDETLWRPDGNGVYAQARHLFPTPSGYNMPSLDRLATPAWTGVAVTADQLFVADSRLLFWNGPPNLTNGAAPDGFIGPSSPHQQPQFTQLKADGSDRVWAARTDRVEVYQAPAVTGQAPVGTVGSTLPVLGGGSLTLGQFTGIAPAGSYLWASDSTTNRVVRIRNPLTSPLVDVILGQTSSAGTLCNRGLVPFAGSGSGLLPDRTMICEPGALSVDRNGNLFVSDHSLETRGNFRLLMFAAALFPPSPSAVIYAPAATKEFPRAGWGQTNNTAPHGYWETAFDSQGRMVAGHNPYLGPRFLDFYNDPTRVNPTDPSDPAFALPDGSFEDFTVWPIALTFDDQDNLYAYDANRGQVRVYLQPFGAPAPTPTPTPVPTQGSVAGTVTSSAGGALAGAKVVLNSSVVRQTRATDQDGHYSFQSLDDGTYTLKFSAQRHVSVTRVVTVAGGPVTLDVVLQER